jgi:hypothetical protein
MHGDKTISGGFVTQGEFSRTLAFLEEIRTDIKGDVAALSSQLTQTKVEITDRQDIANGRTSKNETAVRTAAAQVAAVSAQIEAVQRTVSTIQEKGCSRGDRHMKILSALAEAGVAPDTGEIVGEEVEPLPTAWRRHGKKGLWAGAGAALAVLLPHLVSFLHWLAETLGPPR